MPRPLHVLLLLVLLTVPLRARTDLDHARHARALLGPATWSQIIRIENDGRHSPYPRVVHALVFELAGLLWFYADVNGTQSFSLHRNRLAWEKEHFGPLLRDIEPGFQRWSVVADPAAGWRDDGEPLRNGCFIDSVALLRDRLGRGGPPIRNPRLLSYYAQAVSGLKGHTVLAYEVATGLEIMDPAAPHRATLFPPALGADPLALARAHDGARVVSARTIPLPPPAEATRPPAPSIATSLHNSRNFGS